MKTWTIVGIALAFLGAFILIRGVNLGTRRSVMRFGDLQASVEEQRTIPTWVGAAAIFGGVLLVGVSVRRPRA